MRANQRRVLICAVATAIAALLWVMPAIGDDSSPPVPWPQSVCNRLTVQRQAKSILFHSVTIRIQLITSVCYNGQVITYAGETCRVLRQDTWTIIVDQCSTSNYYYPVTDDPHSGYYSQATFTVSNCFFIKLGCFRSKSVTLGIYVDMVGQYVKDDGR